MPHRVQPEDPDRWWARLAIGFTGVLLAAPLTVAAVVLVQMLYVRDLLGTDVRVLGER